MRELIHVYNARSKLKLNHYLLQEHHTIDRSLHLLFRNVKTEHPSWWFETVHQINTRGCFSIRNHIKNIHRYANNLELGGWLREEDIDGWGRKRENAIQLHKVRLRVLASAPVEMKMSRRDIWDSGPTSTLLIFMRNELLLLLYLLLATNCMPI